MLENNIEEVIKLLHKQGITKIAIEYSGGHDEGSFETPVFYQGDKEVNVHWDKVFNNEDTTYNEDNFLDQIYSDYGRLNQHYSFASEYSCSGTVTIDTKTGNFNDNGFEQTETDTYHTGNVFNEKREVF